MQAGTNQYAGQQMMYWKWANSCSTLLSNTTLQYLSLPKFYILQVYRHRFWHAHYSDQHLDQLGTESFSQAWEVVVVTHILDGIFDARNLTDTQAHTGLDRRLVYHRKTYSIKYPPIKQEKVLTLSIVQSIVAVAATTTDPKIRHISGLVQLGLYFCLRSFKYTKCTVHHRTVQFWPLLYSITFVRDQLLTANHQLSTSVTPTRLSFPCTTMITQSKDNPYLAPDIS